MYEDFGVLAAELERCFGADKVLPSRTELRDLNRWGGGLVLVRSRRPIPGGRNGS